VFYGTRFRAYKNADDRAAKSARPWPTPAEHEERVADTCKKTTPEIEKAREGRFLQIPNTRGASENSAGTDLGDIEGKKT